MLSFLFVSGLLFGVAAVLALVRPVRAFVAAGRASGFDFYSPRAGLWMFRPALLPPPMQPLGRTIRFYAIVLLWPAFLFLCGAWITRR